MRAGSPLASNLEQITLLRQLVAEQQRTNQLLQYLADTKHAELSQIELRDKTDVQYR